MQRVMIIGGPGAGKSWLARHMGVCLDLPVMAIDDFVHDGQGRQRSNAEIDADAIAAASSDRWIIEGGNTRTYQARLERADCVIRLKPSRFTRLWRVFRRGDASVSLLRWAWSYDAVFGSRDDAVVASALGQVGCYDLGSAQEVRDFLAVLHCPSGTTPSPISKGQNGFKTKGSLAPPDRQG